MAGQVHAEHLLLHRQFSVFAEVGHLRQIRSHDGFIREVVQLEKAYLGLASLLCPLLRALHRVVAGRHQLSAVRIDIIKSARADE